MEQAVDKIGAEQQGDAQADDRFRHGEAPLETPTGAGVEAHDDQDDDPEGEIDKVKHVCWLRSKNRFTVLLMAVSRPYGICQSSIKDL
jgi:hypothetical protein